MERDARNRKSPRKHPDVHTIKSNWPTWGQREQDHVRVVEKRSKKGSRKDRRSEGHPRKEGSQSGR